MFSINNVSKWLLFLVWTLWQIDDSSCRIETTEQSTQQQQQHVDENVCGLWFAKSSIPGSGLGMFAGRSFQVGEPLMHGGDVVIPIIDIEMHHGGNWHFLWDDYTWDGDGLWMDNEGLSAINSASPGFGSVANSFLDLHNVDEGRPIHDYARMHRSRDPGTGAFTPYHDRRSHANQPIQMGQELFVSYGENWFDTRLETMGPIPVEGNLPAAHLLLVEWKRLANKYASEQQQHVFTDLVETFLWNSTFASTSRILFAIPKTWKEINESLTMGLVQLRIQQSIRTLDWLQQNGVCADNIRPDHSTLSQAGRGAFATRTIRSGDIVAPLPLIHVPDKKKFLLFAQKTQQQQQQKKNNPLSNTTTSFTQRQSRGFTLHLDKSNVVGQQLLLNYCLGHRHSTMLLCPYGLMTSLINHAPTAAATNTSFPTANAKLQWAQPHRSTHNETWFYRSVRSLKKQKSARLAMEIVATRDIGPDEEIFIDYGPEWQQAWEKHITTWKPLLQSDQYQSADEWNHHHQNIPLETEFEKASNNENKKSIPPNLELKFDMAFQKTNEWEQHFQAGTLQEFSQQQDEFLVDVEIVGRTMDEEGNYWYSVIVPKPKEEEEEEAEENEVDSMYIDRVPRQAFRFRDRPHTSDMFLPNAFRHEIGIPDDIFPKAWKNLLTKQEKEEEEEGNDDDVDEEEEEEQDGSMILEEEWSLVSDEDMEEEWEEVNDEDMEEEWEEIDDEDEKYE